MGCDDTNKQVCVCCDISGRWRGGLPERYLTPRRNAETCERNSSSVYGLSSPLRLEPQTPVLLQPTFLWESLEAKRAQR